MEYSEKQQLPLTPNDQASPDNQQGTDNQVLRISTGAAGMNQSLAVCTIASKNYLGMVRVFAESVRKTNPGIHLYVLLVDRVDDQFDPELEPYQLITLDELEIHQPENLYFKYSPIELNTAVKPFFLEVLIQKYGIEKICYFDPDILVFSKLDHLWDLLENNSIVVTPHITSPYQDDRHPTEMNINLAGVFNLGFLGIANTPNTIAFLKWWQDRLYHFCYMNPGQGMHVDQNWVNFAPVMYDDVCILRDPAYNIAYWNLHERGTRLRFENEMLFIDDRQVAFFHFSGVDPDNIDAVSRYQNRYRLIDFPNIRSLFEYYRDLLNKNNYSEIKKWHYAFGTFENGVTIPAIIRGFYSRLSRVEKQNFGDPFKTSGEDTFFAWINQPEENQGADQRPFTRLQMEIYNTRLDLQKAFPDILGADRKNFINWLMTFAVSELKLSSVFISFEPDNLAGDSTAENVFMNSPRQVIKRMIKTILPEESALLQKIKLLDKKYFRRPATDEQQSAPPVNSRNLPFGVNVSGYIDGEFGVAEVARASIKSLETVQVPLVLNNLQIHVHRNFDNIAGDFSLTNPYHVNLIHVNAIENNEFVHQKGRMYFQDRYNIGYWFWELSHFPKQWRIYFENYQEIWVASAFCQESIAQLSPVPVVKMIFPVLVDESHAVSNRPFFGLPEDKFIFGFHYDFLSSVERKNPLGLIKAFRNAFDETEDALLVIKTINAQSEPEKAALLKKEAKGSNVLFIDGHLARENMISLMASFDSYVSLHRSEGFGIGMAQSMYLGKPVIATSYSGNLDYMNNNNSFLVRYKLKELEQNYGLYEKGNVWAEPDLDHASELMRLVFENRSLTQRVSVQAEHDIKTRLSVQAAGEEMKARLELIA